MSVNSDIYDRAVLHLTSLQRVYTSLDNSIVRELDRHTNRIAEIVRGDGSLQQVLRRVERETIKTYNTLTEMLGTRLLDVADNEVGFQTRNIDRSIRKLGAGITPSRRGLRDAVLNTSFGGNRTEIKGRRTLPMWLKGVQSNEFQGLSRQVRVGFAQGLSREQIVDQLSEVGSPLIRSKADARAIARTAFTHTQNVATHRTYEANEKYISGYQWISTLDGRTSSVCRSRDGRVFKIEDAVLPPAHFNCRSSTVPITKELAEFPASERRKNALSNRERASFDGRRPATEDYSQWLKRQPAGVQDLVLGAAQAEIFRRGNLNIKKFYDIDGNGVSLAQLERLDNATLGGSIDTNPFSIGDDVRIHDIKTPVGSANDLLRVEDELVTFLSAQANTRNTQFANVNLTAPYKEYLANGARGVYVNRRYDNVLGEIVDYKYVPLDSDTFLNELRLLRDSLDSGSVTRKQYDFTQRILNRTSLATEGNQRIVVVRTLRRIFERSDYDPDLANINQYLVGQINSQSRNLTRTKLNQYAKTERARRGFNKSLQEIRSDTAARNRDIRNVEKRFDTFARKNSELLDDILPAELAGIDRLESISDSLRAVGRNLGTDASSLSVSIGRNLYSKVGQTVTVQRAANLGDAVINKLIQTDRIQAYRVRRAPGRDKAITNRDDVRTPTQDVDVTVVDSTDAVFRRYADLLEEDRINGQFGVTPGRATNVRAGDTDDFLQDFVNYEPDRAIDAVQARTLNIDNNIQKTVEPRMVNALEGLLDVGDDHLVAVNARRNGNVTRAIEAARATGNRFVSRHSLDVRGRSYDSSTLLNTQGTGSAKSVIRLGDKKPLGDDGYDNLLSYAGSLVDETSNSNATWLSAGRAAESRLVELGRLIDAGDYEGLSRYRRRHFSRVDDDDVEVLMSIALDVYDANQWNALGRSYATYRSNLINPQDATASAAQHAAGLTRSMSLGRLSNVSPTDFADRPYRLVGQYVKDNVERISNLVDDQGTILLIKSLNQAQLTKIAKHPAMTTLYGSSNFAKIQQVRKAIKKIVPDDPELQLVIDGMSDRDIGQLARLVTEGIDTEVPELGGLYRFLNETFSRVDGVVSYRNTSGSTIFNRYQRTRLTNVEQDVGGISTTARYTDVLEEVDSRAQASAGPANYVHSFDGDLMSRVKRRAADEGIDVIGIHDSWGTHLADSARLNELIREEFVAMYSQDRLRELVTYLRSTNQITDADEVDLLNLLTEGIEVRGTRVILDWEQGELNLDDVLNSEYFTSY